MELFVVKLSSNLSFFYEKGFSLLHSEYNIGCNSVVFRFLLLEMGVSQDSDKHVSQTILEMVIHPYTDEHVSQTIFYFP